jgi:C-terminal processing protease CtpA/Prc
VRYTGDDRATRIADVALAWNVFRHFYPYFDVTGGDWTSELKPALEAAATDANAEAFSRSLRRMVADLHDGHGGVQGPEPSRAAALPVLWAWVEGQLVVTDAMPGAVLRPGDIVLKIDGRASKDVLEDAERSISSATPQWARYRAVRDLRLGPDGSTVVLEVHSTSGGANTTVTLKRTASAAALKETRPEKIAQLKPGIFYVDIDRITDADYTAALPKLEKATGIVFDLRGYPNGLSPAPLQNLTDKPLESARWNVPVITDPDWSRPPEWNTDGRWTLPPAAPRLKAKIAFVTDGRAISYAETWMGIVEAYKLGAIVGETTAGTNGNINPFTVPGGYTFYWTGMKVLKHDGSRHHGVGIAPTVPVSRTVRGIAEGRDEQLDRAVAVVSS